MKRNGHGKKRIACILIVALCLSSVLPLGHAAAAQTDMADAGEGDVTLNAPSLDAEGRVVWDCVYFGNYWQSLYVTQSGEEPAQGEEDVVHTDTDGTKYLVREDKKCYRSEPVKWRVLSVSEDGRDALLMADKIMDYQQYHPVYSEVTWENARIRTWLNEEFRDTAFTDEEKAGILPTQIENKKSPEYVKGEEEQVQDEVSTTDSIWLPSREEMTSRAYGFTDDTGNTDTRKAENTDFSRFEGNQTNYQLRTMMAKERVSHVAAGNGTIPTESIYVLLGAVNDWQGIRPMLHLDLTKTDIWHYAGTVRQDMTVTEPDASATPETPTQQPTVQPQVTMAPGQQFPKNPMIHEKDEKKNTWDCIYFGNYYNTKITPSVLAGAGEHGTEKEGDKKEPYVVRHEQGYFRYEPMKWRVLSVNEDGTDAFLLADQVMDIAPYYQGEDEAITWEKSDIRKWLNQSFVETAFTKEEQAAVETTDVTTADNQWSKEPGGNDTKDKVYLPSIEEMLNEDYGFSARTEEGDTRNIKTTDYVDKGGTFCKPADGFMSYWLRSPGTAKGKPAQVGNWGKGEIPTEGSVMTERAEAYLGVRPVLHVDLSDTTLWDYAGQVTPEGVVIPEESSSPEPTENPTEKPTENPTQIPSQNPTQIPSPDVTPRVAVPTQKPAEIPAQSAEPEGKISGKPVLKSLKNKKGKKVTVTIAGKISGADGYQVAYAAKPSMKGQKSKLFRGTSVTVKGLKKKKTYYFRVRAYRKINGKNEYGSWSGKKRIKVKK